MVHRADLQASILKSRTEGFFGLNLLQDRRPEHYAAVVDQSYRFPSELLARRAAAGPPAETADRRPRLAEVALGS